MSDLYQRGQTAYGRQTQHELKRFQEEQALARELVRSNSFASHEELVDYSLFLRNPERPLRTEFAVKFIRIYQANKLQTTIEAKKELTSHMWGVFMRDLEMQDDVVPKFKKTDLQD